MDILTTLKKPTFICNLCNFETSNKKDYSRHLMTAKHKKQQIGYNTSIFLPPKTPLDESAVCDCGKEYKHYSGLWRHKKKCSQQPANKRTIEPELTNSFIPESTDANVIFELLKQNTEFKEMLIQQNKTILDLASKAGNNNNTTNNNNTNNFNLNVFLNENCKDAMNMTDFIQDMQITNEEFENFSKIGYVAGIADLFMNRMQLMDITKRPLHCTDVKRDILYIRDENAWKKDNEDNSMLRVAIKHVAKKNLSKLPEWRAQHPNSDDFDHEHYALCMSLFRNALGDSGEELVKLNTKIIKYIAKMVILDKNSKNIGN